jgi:hypothetical protein
MRGNLVSILFAILFVGLLFPGAVRAQSFDLTNVDPFTVSMSPQNPAPYSQVTLSVVSASLTLTNATMMVSMAGTQVYSGNIQPVTVTLGGPGVLTTITVTISVNGTKYTQTLSVRPQDVVLVAEPVSSAPVLYPGEPLVPLDGNVRVVAVANLKDTSGKTIDPSLLSYAWTVDGTQIASASGIGKETIMVASPLEYRERDVSVTVESQDTNAVGSADLSFTAQAPTMRIYQNDPLLGILYDHSLGTGYTIIGTETSFYAVPFSYPITNSNPVLQWFLNGASAQTGGSITLRPTGSGRGTASISVVGTSDDYTKAASSLLVSFGNQSSGNLFGL